MSSERETMRVQVTLDKELGAKIDDLADRLGVSQSKMVEFLLDAAVDQNEVIIKAVTHRWAIALREVWTGKKLSNTRAGRERAAREAARKAG